MFRIVTSAENVKTRLASLARLNLELARLEAKRRAMALGVAFGLGIVAGVLLLYAIGFGFAAAAVGLSEAVPLWLALLIVAAVILLVSVVLAFLAVRFAKKAWPATPTQAIDEAELTAETLRSHG